LTDSFRALGVTILFNPEFADFGGMTISRNHLIISEVFHQANVNVNEQGTEASGSTAVVMSVTDYDTSAVDFNCNRPFMFIIHDTVQNQVLFIGKYTKPEKKLRVC
jgi:serine protease inhibitor